MEIPIPLLTRLGENLVRRGWCLATAESCTGGLVGHWATSVAGSSNWFAGGIIAYANAVKCELLGVAEQTLAEHGAVSQVVVETMACAVARQCRADCAVALSGVAGPGGGSEAKPVGTVWIAWRLPEAVYSERFVFQGDRATVKNQSALMALERLETYVRQ